MERHGLHAMPERLGPWRSVRPSPSSVAAKHAGARPGSHEVGGSVSGGAGLELLPCRSHTVKYGALRIAFKKSGGDLGPNSLGQTRNQGGRAEGPRFLRAPQAIFFSKFVFLLISKRCFGADF